MELTTTTILLTTMLSAPMILGSNIRSKRTADPRECPTITTINRSIRDLYCEQPLFVNFLPKSDEAELLDNICYTYFPLPDDPATFQIYVSLVFCDGSNTIISYIGTDYSPGLLRVSSPYSTCDYKIFGYAGCDTYLANVCTQYGDDPFYLNPYFEGLTTSCRPIGLSCLKKVEEILEENGLPEINYYVLPMKLPNRCVTQQQCLVANNHLFYKSLGFAGPLY